MKGLYEAGGDFDMQHNYKHEQHCLALRVIWDVLQHPFFKRWKKKLDPSLRSWHSPSSATDLPSDSGHVT